MKVSIGHLTFSVVRTAPDDASTHADFAGLCNKRTGLITLYAGASAQEEAATLVHELIHGIWHAHSLPDEMDEERACRLLEGPLLALMADNPQVVAALIAARGGVRLNLD